MEWKQQQPKPGFDMPEVVLLVPQPLHRPGRASSPLDATSSLHPADGLTVWGATRRVDFSWRMY